MKSTLGSWLVAAAAVAILLPQGVSTQAAQPARTMLDVSKLGPKIGERVPDFQLRDQSGRIRNLQSIMGSRGAMLVFFRSADW